MFWIIADLVPKKQRWAARPICASSLLVKIRQIDSSTSGKTLAEEVPAAYKDIDNAIRVVHETGISKKVARLWPIGVIKG